MTQFLSPVCYNQSHMYSHKYQKYLQNTDKILKTKAVISSSLEALQNMG